VRRRRGLGRKRIRGLLKTDEEDLNKWKPVAWDSFFGCSGDFAGQHVETKQSGPWLCMTWRKEA